MGPILKTYCGFIYGARHFSTSLKFSFFHYKNDGEKCLPPKMKPEWFFRIGHFQIGHPVSFIIGGDIIEGNIIGEDVDIRGPSLASRK